MKPLSLFRSICLLCGSACLAFPVFAQHTIQLTLTIRDSMDMPRLHYLATGRIQDLLEPMVDAAEATGATTLDIPQRHIKAQQEARQTLSEACKANNWALIFPYDQIPYDYSAFPTRDNFYRENEFRIMLKDTNQVKAFLKFADQHNETFSGSIEPVYQQAIFPPLTIAAITEAATLAAQKILNAPDLAVQAITAIYSSPQGGWTSYPPLSQLNEKAFLHPVNPNEINGKLRQFRSLEVSVSIRLSR